MRLGKSLAFLLADLLFPSPTFGEVFSSLRTPYPGFLRHRIRSNSKLQRRQNSSELITSSHAPLTNFQVMQPPVVPLGGRSCVVTLIADKFGNSFGKPAKRKYSAPTHCGNPGSWAAVILNLTITSKGNQFDRLSSIFLNEVEIMRTSTAEPTPDGIIWTVFKDITKYMPLLAASEGELVMNLDNMIDKSIGIDGAFFATLSFKYYEPVDAFPAPRAAHAIIPISKAGGQMFSENPAVASVTIPVNTVSAFVEIYASGAAQEEFWYTNILDEAASSLTFAGNKSVTGKGSFRELQLWIDTTLAGVALPYPVIFTGGIILSWWSPMAAYGAFDQPTYIIDITPFIPTLTDGKPHNFTLAVEGLGANRSINGNFFLSGNVALITDPSSTRTTGKITQYENTPRLVTSAGLCKDGLRTVIRAGRVLSIQSDLVTGSGTKRASFSQTTVFKSTQLWDLNGKAQQVKQISIGTSKSTSNAETTFSEAFRYPLNLSLTTTQYGMEGKLNHGYNRVMKPASFTGFATKVNTQQKSKGFLNYQSPGRVQESFGQTEQTFNYSDAKGSTYQRDVSVGNVTKILRDAQSGSLSTSATGSQNFDAPWLPSTYNYVSTMAVVDSEQPPLMDQVRSKAEGTDSADSIYGLLFRTLTIFQER